jgi:tRNA (mo5U34)-methyltransferase
VDDSEIEAAVRANPTWYHTIDLPGGVTTPGWFDLRERVDDLPWPDLEGKRCLDVGTYDGFLAFEMERRGAAEVVAVDIPSHEAWDWPADARAVGPERLAQEAGEKGRGFEIAREALGSKVERRWLNIYDLSPEEVGRFDVVMLGALLLHLRDPIRALEAIRSVCAGHLLSWEQIELELTLLHPRRPVASFNGSGFLCQWWVPNLAGYLQMLFSGGFEVLEKRGPWTSPFGPGHPELRWNRRQRALQRVVTRGVGLPCAAALGRPRL